MSIKRKLLKPEYYLRPQQLVKRMFPDDKSTNDVDLLWGHKNFKINTDETIGKSIRNFGLYDLALSEAIIRLIGRDSVCVDVGANIGYFTSLMASLGKHVHAFEAHPEIFKRLHENTHMFQNTHLVESAVSAEKGVLHLSIPSGFEKNQGTATLENIESSNKVQVQTVCLDDALKHLHIDLLKIDVEGHELEVLKGAHGLLEGQAIQNIVFEDFACKDSKVIQQLRAYGYKIFRITKGFFDLKVVDVADAHRIPLWEPPNFIATFDVSRLTQSSGYKLLKL